MTENLLFSSRSIKPTSVLYEPLSQPLWKWYCRRFGHDVRVLILTPKLFSLIFLHRAFIDNLGLEPYVSPGVTVLHTFQFTFHRKHMNNAARDRYRAAEIMFKQRLS